MKVLAIVFFIAFVLLNISTVRSDRNEDFFKRIDLNGDGKLSQEEIEAYVEDLMEKLKALGNKDGNTPFGDPAELEAKIRAAFLLADLDQDGFVTLDEYRESIDAITAFLEVDKNADGKVTFEELKAAAEKFFPTEGLREAFDKIDTNKDGNISLEEFKSIPKGVHGQALESVLGK